MPRTQIVVADDDGEIRNLISECLNARGFAVRQAADGKAALDVVERAPGIALLITDLNMPRMTGQELIEKSLALRPELKVVAITGHAGMMPTGEALKARRVKTFLKPFDFDKFCDEVAEMATLP